MPSPFPGMDPYIEAPEVWGDFHGRLASEISAALNHHLRPRYVARLTPYVTYESIEIAGTVGIRPDVGVWRAQPPRALREEAVLTITPPVAESEIEYEVPVRLYTVELHWVETMELVTAIEILSPVNKKRGHDAHIDYLRKRRDLLHSTTHFMEIDLLRGGERSPLEKPVPLAPYYITLSRSNRRPKVDVWAIRLQDKLPVLPIPLREPDSDVALDLSTIVVNLYEQGGYDMLIDYSKPPPLPKLSEADAAWLEICLKEQKH
jgi:hypothetical protein